MRSTYIVVAALLLILVVGLGFQFTRTHQEATLPTDWTLKRIDSGAVKFSDYQGKVRLLNFWASWCGTCREEMPDLVSLSDSYHGKNFSLLSINFGEGRDTAQQFATSYGAKFPVLLDPGKKVSTSYGVVTMPTSMLLDKNGKVVKIWVGQINPTQAKDRINKLLQ